MRKYVTMSWVASLIGLIAAGAVRAQEAAAAAAPMPATEADGGAVGFWLQMPVLIAMGGIVLLLVLIRWRIFAKAGKPGIASIVPIWGEIVFCQVCGKPGWWFLLMMIPGVNMIIMLLLCMGLAQQFGKGAGFGIGLFLLPIIFMPVLAFGGAVYEGGMELPEFGGMEGGPIGGGRGGMPMQRPPVTDATRYTVAAWIAIVAFLMLAAVAALQYFEIDYYASDLPECGTGSAWPAKPEPAPAAATGSGLDAAGGGSGLDSASGE